jgi:hypothetical protein
MGLLDPIQWMLHARDVDTIPIIVHLSF